MNFWSSNNGLEVVLDFCLFFIISFINQMSILVDLQSAEDAFLFFFFSPEKWRVLFIVCSCYLQGILYCSLIGSRTQCGHLMKT